MHRYAVYLYIHISHNSAMTMAAVVGVRARLPGGLSPLLLSLFLFLSPVSSYIVEVPANSDECFLEDITRGQKVIGSYSVSQGGKLDIDMKVCDV